MVDDAWTVPGSAAGGKAAVPGAESETASLAACRSFFQDARASYGLGDVTTARLSPMNWKVDAK